MMDWKELEEQVNVALMLEVKELKQEILELKSELAALKAMTQWKN